jgi:hypothetical protein
MTQAPQKVTLLKRAISASPPSAPGASAAADAVRAALSGALARERARADSLTAARTDALLAVVRDVLSDALRDAINSAATAEAAALALTVRNIKAPEHAACAGEGKTQAGVAVGKADSKADSADAVAGMRRAFGAAFEEALLDSMEASVRGMLACVSGAVDTAAEEAVAKPAANAAAQVLRRAADDVRAAAGGISVLGAEIPAAGGSEDEDEIVQAVSVDKEEAALAEVARALAEGRVKDALVQSVGHSAVVRAKAVSGALDSGVAPDEVLSGEADGLVTLRMLSGLCGLLAGDLADRTDARLAWLYEAVMGMENAPREGGSEQVAACTRLLTGAAEKLGQVQRGVDGATGAEARQAKMLVRALRSTIAGLGSV